MSETTSNLSQVIGRLAAARERPRNSVRAWAGLRMLGVFVVDEELSSANALVRLLRHGARATLPALDSYGGVSIGIGPRGYVGVGGFF